MYIVPEEELEQIAAERAEAEKQKTQKQEHKALIEAFDNADLSPNTLSLMELYKKVPEHADSEYKGKILGDVPYSWHLR